MVYKREPLPRRDPTRYARRIDHQPYPNVKEAGTIEGFYPSQRAALSLSAGSPDYNPIPRMSYPCPWIAGKTYDRDCLRGPLHTSRLSPVLYKRAIE